MWLKKFWIETYSNTDSFWVLDTSLNVWLDVIEGRPLLAYIVYEMTQTELFPETFPEVFAFGSTPIPVHVESWRVSFCYNQTEKYLNFIHATSYIEGYILRGFNSPELCPDLDFVSQKESQRHLSRLSSVTSSRLPDNPHHRHQSQPCSLRNTQKCRQKYARHEFSYCNLIYQGWPDFFARGPNLKIIFLPGPHLSKLVTISAKQIYFLFVLMLIEKN